MPTTAVRLVCRLLLAAAVLLGAFSGVLAGAVPATAHATLTGTSPAQNSVVGTAPELVSLTFSERVGMSDGAVRILDPNGDRVDTGSLVDQRDGDVVTYGVKLKPGVPEGTFTVAWKAVSADSHPISGAWTFSIGRPSETAAGVTGRQSASAAVQNLYTVGRYAAYSGFVLLVGGAGFVLLGNWRQAAGIRDVQRLTVAGWLLLAASTTLLLLLRHPYTTAGGLSDVFSLSGLRVVLETTSGSALVSRLLLLATAALFLAVLFGAYRRERGAKEQADLHFGLVIGWTVVSAGIAATWAMSEHASTGIQPQVAMPVDVLHLLAVAVWFGGLTMLLTTLHRGPAVPAEAVRRFSRLAFGSVLVLVATGVYQSWRQVGTWSALTSTDYGRLLMVKVGLMVVLTAVAFFSRRWTGRLADRAGATTAADAAEPEPEVVGAGA
ncbi:copper resistance CopC/CopD family protein, partial [Streptomyces sparsus]